MFKDNYPFICDKCGQFLKYLKSGYCQNCGAEAVRKATDIDYENYEKGKSRKTEVDIRKNISKDKGLNEERRKTHLKTFPYICNKCKNFAHVEYKYCQYCGAAAVRKTTDIDYENYEKGKKKKSEVDKIAIISEDKRLIEERRKKLIELSEERKLRSEERSERRKIYLETYPYICDNCKNFAIGEYKYCQFCGVQGKIRLAKISDYDEISQVQLQQKIEEEKLILAKIPSEQKIEEQEPVQIKKPPEKIEPPETTFEQYEKKSEEKLVEQPINQIQPSNQLEIQTQTLKLPPEQIVKSPVTPVKPKKKKEIVQEKITPPKPEISECPFCGIQIEIKDIFCQQCGYILKK
ncbi:MAG: hypothetical protein ACFE75_03565 [Candidatus Hodarchaeota archaeon]